MAMTKECDCMARAFREHDRLSHRREESMWEQWDDGMMYTRSVGSWFLCLERLTGSRLVQRECDQLSAVARHGAHFPGCPLTLTA